MRIKIALLAVTIAGLLATVISLAWGIHDPTFPVAQLALALFLTGTVAVYRLLLFDR